MKQKVYVTTTFNKCMSNNYLTAQIGQFFTENEYEVVTAAEEADCIIVTTCGFDQPREDFSMETVKRYSTQFPEKRIVVSGCLPGINPAVGSFRNVVTVNTDRLEELNQLFPVKRRLEVVRANEFEEIAGSGKIELYKIEISKGCPNMCSYCIIRKTKGRPVSKPVADIVAEVKDGVAAGYRRFCFLADNCACYGVDINSSLAELLERVADVDDQIEIMLYYAEPQQFIRAYQSISKRAFSRVCYVDLPVQSGSRRVLTAMNRNYEPSAVFDLIQTIKRDHPKTELATHFLVGFPGETMEDLWDSIALSSSFDQVTFFPYTDRAGTPAVDFPDKVSKEEMTQRTELLSRIVADHPKMQLVDTAFGH